MAKPSFLMCPPRYFGVEYVINPWMEGQVHHTDLLRATEQWDALSKLLAEHGKVETMLAVDGLPDLVFTANAGLQLGDRTVVSSFRCPERQPESKFFAHWFREQGFEVHTLPEGVLFEGAGDALLDRAQRLLWMGYGMRSNLEACGTVSDVLAIEVQPLRLQNPSFYHLDTCFCPLDSGYLLYYPEAFDAGSRAAIEKRVPVEKRIEADAEDAANFACNAVNIGSSLIANSFSDRLAARLREAGFKTTTTPLTEFMRSGGAAKCLSLRVNEG